MIRLFLRTFCFIIIASALAEAQTATNTPANTPTNTPANTATPNATALRATAIAGVAKTQTAAAAKTANAAATLTAFAANTATPYPTANATPVEKSHFSHFSYFDLNNHNKMINQTPGPGPFTDDQKGNCLLYFYNSTLYSVCPDGTPKAY